jgi:hypothetical protein
MNATRVAANHVEECEDGMLALSPLPTSRRASGTLA